MRMLTALQRVSQKIRHEIKSAWRYCFVPFDRQHPPVSMPGSMCICTQCELCVDVCLRYRWARLSWAEEMWTRLCLQLCSPQLCHRHHVCLFVLHMLFFQVQGIFSLSVQFVWSSVNSLNSTCFGPESHRSTSSGLSSWLWSTPAVYAVTRLSPCTHVACWGWKSALLFHTPSLFFICCWKPRSGVECWIPWKYLWLGCSVCKEHPSTVPHLQSTQACFDSSLFLSTRSYCVAVHTVTAVQYWEIRLCLMQRHEMSLCCGHLWFHGLENCLSKHPSMWLSQNHNHFLFHSWKVVRFKINQWEASCRSCDGNHLMHSKRERYTNPAAWDEGYHYPDAFSVQHWKMYSAF